MKVLRGVGGFTLVELLLALFVGAVLMSAIYVTMISGQRSSAGVERKVAAQQDVRAALEIMAMEISMASYNPNFIPGIWTDGSTCAGASPNQAYKGIQEATATTITVEMDIGESNSIGDNENEIIRYTYDAANQFITRRTNCGTAQPFLGANPAAPAGTRTVRLINNTAGINNGPGHATPAVFRYYDSNGTELYPYAGKNPGDIANIRRIDITLAVETEERDPATNAFRQMIYSTSVLVRNHAIN
jgi:prepilin-type N-terminal cleavage/methylation domain-containing protein